MNKLLLSSTVTIVVMHLLASERSERDTYRDKNEKIGDVCLLASERSERDSIRGG